jgi:crotonobetainyl-CoA:carnitine CoA-transferase CaiB-like acyl-CoA transferase
MVDAALNIAAEQVIEHSAYGALLERAGNRGPAAAPQNLYVTSDLDRKGRTDTWVAVAVATDEQWLALVGALGNPAWAADDALRTHDGRVQAHDLVDEHLAAWCRTREVADIVDRLWGAGVPVAEVRQPHDQADLEQLQARGFFEAVDHPVIGRSRHSTLPMVLSRGPERVHARPAPLLGQHNDELLTELGLTADEIAVLEVDGVIGRTLAESG